MPGAAEHEWAAFAGFLEHMHHMRMIGHRLHIGFLAELAETQRHGFELLDAQVLVADEQHAMVHQCLAQIGLSGVTEVVEVDVVDVCTQ